jgi:hypothetical protein
MTNLQTYLKLNSSSGYSYWLNIGPADGDRDARDCRDAECDGLFAWSGGRGAPYVWAEAGVAMLRDQGTNCFRYLVATKEIRDEWCSNQYNVICKKRLDA